MINTYVPFLGKEEKKNLQNCFKTNFFSTAGPLIKKFEINFSKIFNFKNSVALNSGTSSLHLGLKAIGVQKGDLVIVPSYTFAATVNAIIYCGAEPWFFDINKEFELDINLVQNQLMDKTEKKNNNLIHKSSKKIIRAIIPVSSFGKKLDFRRYSDFSKKNSLKILFDVAASHDPKIFQFVKKNNMNFAFSLNGNKTLTSGSGGVFASNSKSVINKVRILSNVGKGKSNYDIRDVGYNYRMSNLQAAIALGQLKKLNQIFNLKKKIFFEYSNALKKLINFEVFNDSKFINWVFFIILKKKNDFKKYKANFNRNHIQLEYFWKPLHLQKPYKKFLKTKLKFTEYIWKKIVILPSHPGLTKDQVYKVIRVIKNI